MVLPLLPPPVVGLPSTAEVVDVGCLALLVEDVGVLSLHVCLVDEARFCRESVARLCGVCTRNLLSRLASATAALSAMKATREETSIMKKIKGAGEKWEEEGEDVASALKIR